MYHPKPKKLPGISKDNLISKWARVNCAPVLAGPNIKNLTPVVWIKTKLLCLPVFWNSFSMKYIILEIRTKCTITYSLKTMRGKTMYIERSPNYEKVPFFPAVIKNLHQVLLQNLYFLIKILHQIILQNLYLLTMVMNVLLQMMRILQNLHL